jgi:putative membrane protein
MALRKFSSPAYELHAGGWTTLSRLTKERGMMRMALKGQQEREEPDSIIGDKLARERTLLANERTLLAYIRTALGFLVLGVPLIVMFPAGLIWTFGLLALGLAGGLVVLGVVRFTRVRNRLQRSEDVSSSNYEASLDGARLS